MQILIAWLAYLVAAVGCYWCWTKLFFWVKQNEARLFVKLVGAILLFMPAPATQGQDDYVPAFIIVAFRGLLDKDPSYIDAVIWMLSGLVLGMIIVGFYILYQSLVQKPQTAEKGKAKAEAK